MLSMSDLVNAKTEKCKQKKYSERTNTRTMQMPTFFGDGSHFISGPNFEWSN
jgi:hypothetical protein